MDAQSIYIWDSYGLIYRSYYAFINRPLINEKGQNVSAIFGFFRNLLGTLEKNNPQYGVAAFDSLTPTFRHQLYEEYKATRQKTPEDLHAQIPVIEEILTALGLPILRVNGYEADDIIATIASLCREEKRYCRIFSADKDLMQLVNDTTFIMKPDKAGGWEKIAANGVEAEWGVPPEKMLDMLSLIGDTADNVPGVQGVGVKTALKLLLQYGSLEEIFNHQDEIKGSLGEKIRNGKDMAFFSKKLIALDCHVPLPVSLNDFSIQSLDFAAAARLLYHYGVPAVAKQYEQYASRAAGKTEVMVQKEETNFSVQDEFVGEAIKNKGNYHTVTRLEALTTFIDRALEKKLAAFDLETNSLDTQKASLVGFSLSVEKGSGVYVPLLVQDSLLAGEVLAQREALKQLERLFFCKDMTIVMHNGKFDMKVLYQQGFFDQTKMTATLYDTMIAAWLLQSDRSSYSLEDLAQRKLGLIGVNFSDIVPKGSTFESVDLEVATNYAAEDADLTLQLWNLFEPQLKKANLFDLFVTLEMPVMHILCDMEINGIHLEKNELAHYSLELKEKINSIEQEIYELVGHPFNIASTKQLQEVLFTERNLPTSKKTKTGYSTDTTVLEELAAIDVVPAKILEYRTLSKLLSTYVDVLPLLCDAFDRLHTSFIQTGTATGRLSSRDPNLQNIPIKAEEGRRIRQAFTAKEGYQLISADYSQIELVLLAHLSQDKALCKAFNDGVDVHKATASLIFGVTPEKVTSDMRRTAKTINFGVMYGMSAFRLSNELKISRTLAKEFIDTYFATYNGIQQFMANTIAKAEETGMVETIFGRKRPIFAITSRNKTEKAGAERIAVNTPIQGSAADIVKKAMIQVAEMLRQYKDAHLLLQVHDELILEVPESQAEEIALKLKNCMENVVSLSVPLRVSVEVGKRWGDFH